MEIITNLKTGYIFYGKVGTGKTTEQVRLMKKLYSDYRPGWSSTLDRDVAAILTPQQHLYKLIPGIPEKNGMTMHDSYLTYENKTFVSEHKGIANHVSSITVAKQLAEKETTVEQICNTLILSIDDIGKEAVEAKAFGTEIKPIQDIVFKRYDMRFRTDGLIDTGKLVDIYSCNVPEGQSLRAYLKNTYGEAVSDRILEMCTPIHWDGKNHRIDEFETNLF